MHGLYNYTLLNCIHIKYKLSVAQSNCRFTVSSCLISGLFCCVHCVYSTSSSGRRANVLHQPLWILIKCQIIFINLQVQEVAKQQAYYDWGENSNRRPRLSKSNEHRGVTTTRNLFPRHCVWERLAAPRSEESVKASSDGNAAAPVSGRQAQPGSASPVTVRENVPGMPPVSNQSQWLFVLFFSPDTVVRGVQKPFEHLSVCVLFFFTCQ